MFILAITFLSSLHSPFLLHNFHFSLFLVFLISSFFFFLFLNLLVSCYIDIFLFFFILFSLFLFFLRASLLLSPFMYYSFCYVFVRTLMLTNQKNKCSLDAGHNCCYLETGAQAPEKNHPRLTWFSCTLGAARGRSMPWHAGLLCLRTGYRPQILQLAGVTRSANIADVGLEASSQWVQRLSHRVYRNTRELRFYAPCHSVCCINYPPFSWISSNYLE